MKMKELFGNPNRVYFIPAENIIQAPTTDLSKIVTSVNLKDLSVENDSIKLEENNPNAISTIMSQIQFDLICKNEDIAKIFYSTHLGRAKEWLESIKKSIKDFYVSDHPHNRKERRLRAKQIKTDILRFKTFCKNHHIEIKNRT